MSKLLTKIILEAGPTLTKILLGLLIISPLLFKLISVIFSFINYTTTLLAGVLVIVVKAIMMLFENNKTTIVNEIPNNAKRIN